MEYVVLDENKVPTCELRGGGRPLEEVKDFENLAVLIPEPYVVLDFDTHADSEIMLKLVEDLELNCMVMQATRGIHVWFRSPVPLKNSIKTRSAIGIHYDVRSWGKISYVVIKRGGKWRKWLRTCNSENMDEFPFWLKPIRHNKYVFRGMGDGDGRNQALFEYILTLQSKGFSRDEIKEILRIINYYLFSDPLTESELDVIVRDEAFLEAEELETNMAIASCFDDEGRFKHNLFAELLVGDMNIVTVNDLCYVYEDGYYQLAERTIDQRMIELYPSIRRNQRAEVIDYIKILTHVSSKDIPIEEYVINVKNGRLDLRTGELSPFTPEVLDFARIPVTYDPNAYSADLDKMLRRVFQNDQEVLDLFEEMVGYMLIKNCRFRKGFLFYGSGSNGKSTILNLLKRFIGEENVSTIELEKLSDRFKTAELENKMVNIGDDINHREIVDTGTLKKLFTGESVTVERKGQDPFTLKSYAKMIFSTNQIPRIADKSHGMYSRLMLIPFNARFSSTDEDFDPFIEDKITTEESLSYLLNMALRGLNRLLTNNCFTEPEVVKKALADYQRDQSTVLTWIEEEGITHDDLLNNFTDQLFSEFQDWCTLACIKYQASIRTFHKEIEDNFQFERRRVRNQDTGGKYKWEFIPKLD